MKIDRLIRSRRKTIALMVMADGSLVVRAPLFATDAQVNDFVARKADWIRARQAEARAARPLAHTYADGDSFFYLGKTYPLRLVKQAARPLQFDKAFLLAEAARPQAQALLQNWYKEQAHQLILPRVVFQAGLTGLDYRRLRITSAATRWGSCSSSGTLSFSWRLVMAPPQAIDYVIIHELVHTVEHHHGPTFWARVGQIIPDYKLLDRWLKRNAQFLTV